MELGNHAQSIFLLKENISLNELLELSPETRALIFDNTDAVCNLFKREKISAKNLLVLPLEKLAYVLANSDSIKTSHLHIELSLKEQFAKNNYCPCYFSPLPSSKNSMELEYQWGFNSNLTS